MGLTPCIPWDGPHRKSDGRPMDGRRYAYRLIYEREVGPIPVGMVLHHECEHPWCVNPAHLKPMRQGAHLRGHLTPGDWGQAQKVTCPKGHAYDVANTYVYRRANGTVERHCRTCTRENGRRWRAARRGWT